MATVELRGPCHHVQGEYEVEEAVLVRKCRWCTSRKKKPVYHRWKLGPDGPVLLDPDDTAARNENEGPLGDLTPQDDR